MKNVLFLSIFILSIGIMQDTNAQAFGKYLERKAKQASKRAASKADQKVTDEMNKQVDKTVENAIDSIFSSEDASSESTAPSSSGSADDALSKAWLNSMGIGAKPANVQDKYEYSGNILMSVNTWNKNGDEQDPVDYLTYMSDSYSGFAMEFLQNNQKSTMIFDTKNGVMVILTESDGTKSGFATSYETDSLLNENDFEYDDKDIEDYSVYNEDLKKTGRTKNIAGYKCDEYQYENEYSKGSLWLTNDLPAELWGRIYGANVIPAASAGYYGGFAMEMNEEDKESGERSRMLVKEVNLNNPKSISTSDYNIMSFGTPPGTE